MIANPYTIAYLVFTMLGGCMISAQSATSASEKTCFSEEFVAFESLPGVLDQGYYIDPDVTILKENATYTLTRCIYKQGDTELVVLGMEASRGRLFNCQAQYMGQICTSCNPCNDVFLGNVMEYNCSGIDMNNSCTTDPDICDDQTVPQSVSSCFAEPFVTPTQAPIASTSTEPSAPPTTFSIEPNDGTAPTSVGSANWPASFSSWLLFASVLLV